MELKKISTRPSLAVAALVVLAGCSEQSTAPTSEISYERLKEMAFERLGPGFQPNPTYVRPGFSEPCIVPGGGDDLVSDRVELVDDAPVQASGECQQRFTTWLASKTTAKALQPRAPLFSMTAGCPVTSHDMIVSAIGDLRSAVATAAPGTVIGIDGHLDINSDGGGDVVVTSDGITLTCATDGAGLFGVPTAGTGVLDVQANQVRVEWLDVTALPETGGPDRSRGVVVSGDEGVVSHNRIGCERTCVFFVGASGGLAEYNDVTSGFKFFGIVATTGENVTVTDNWLVDCFSCVRFSAHNSGQAQGNDVSNCLDTCVWFENSVGGLATENRVQFTRLGITSGSSQDISVVGNTVADCFDACVSSGTFGGGPRTTNFSVVGNQVTSCGDFTTAGCMWLTELDGGLVEDNDIHGALNAMAVRLVSANDVVANDNRFEGSVVAIFSTGITSTDNTVSNCLFECVTVFNSPETEIRDNEITGDGVEDFFGISAQESPEFIAEENTIGGTFEVAGINVEMGFPDGSAVISDNKVEIATEFGTGISLSFVANGEVRDNEIELVDGGPDSRGISLSGQANKFTVKRNGEIEFEDEFFRLVTGNTVKDNTVNGAGVGIFVNGACTNTFVGNDLASTGTGAFFTLVGRDEFSFQDPESGDLIEVTFDLGGTGANTLSGDGTVVEATQFGLPSVGYLDCDADGAGDPNIFGDVD